MSKTSNRFQTILHEFIIKLSRNFETQKVTLKSCEVTLSFWSKHLSQVKNSKVEMKIENFFEEIFENVGIYFMRKYRDKPGFGFLGRVQSPLEKIQDNDPKR